MSDAQYSIDGIIIERMGQLLRVCSANAEETSVGRGAAVVASPSTNLTLNAQLRANKEDESTSNAMLCFITADRRERVEMAPREHRAPRKKVFPSATWHRVETNNCNDTCTAVSFSRRILRVSAKTATAWHYIIHALRILH